MTDASTVVFDITGTPPIVVAVGVPLEGRAALLGALPASPDAWVCTDRRTFARLAGGRWTGERARAEGDVRVDGDADLANRVVDNLAFTI